jgi:hypothetical protein
VAAPSQELGQVQYRPAGVVLDLDPAADSEFTPSL